MGESAATFARVSTGGQDEQSQVPELEGHCEARGYEIARRYSLKGKSAFKGEQLTEIERVVSDIRRGLVSVVVVWALDRWCRTGITAYFALKHSVEAAGGRLEFVREPSMSELEEAVKAFMAEQESKRKAERTRIGIEAALVNGAAVTNAPWGYRFAGEKRAKRWEPTAAGRVVIPELFGLISSGLSVRDAASKLSGQHGKKWSAGTVAAAIRNPAYRGTPTGPDGQVLHRCEALVDAALWQRANTALGDVKRHTRGRAPKAMLTGMRCGTCGGPMYRTETATRRGSGAYSYYRCVACKLAVATHLAERAVEYAIITVFQDAELVERVLVPGENHEAELEAVAWELRELPKQGLDEDAEDARRAELRAERRRLQALPAVPDRWEEISTGISIADHFQALEDDQERGAWLRSYGVTVRAWKDRVEVTIPGSEPVTVALSRDTMRVVQVA